MAALLIAGIAITYLVTTEIESARNISETQALRRALLLGKTKLNEIVLGTEKALSGSFEEPESWFWEAYSTVDPNLYNAQKVTVTVHYYVGNEEKVLSLERVLP